MTQEPSRIDQLINTVTALLANSIPQGLTMQQISQCQIAWEELINITKGNDAALEAIKAEQAQAGKDQDHG